MTKHGRQGLSLFWVTRGKHWDYDAIHVPMGVQVKSLFTLRETLFRDLVPGSVGSLTKRIFRDDQGNSFRCLATTFVDPAREDSAGRSIHHFLAVFADENDVAFELPDNWGEQLVAAVNEHLNHWCDLLPDALQDWEEKHLSETFPSSVRSATADVLKACPLIQEWNLLRQFPEEFGSSQLQEGTPVALQSKSGIGRALLALTVLVGLSLAAWGIYLRSTQLPQG
ncbi:hypothetical protein D3C72_132360 [compost metagenome]